MRGTTLCTVAAAAAFLGCSGDSPSPTGEAPPGVERITITPGQASVPVGQSIQLSAVALDAAGAPVPGAEITWTSSNPSAATVGPDGMVRAVARLPVSIQASHAGVGALAPLDVTRALVETGVVYISRSPRLPPPTSLDDPPDTGWPQEGAPVEWIAHVFNLGVETAEGASWSWTVNGTEVASGIVDLPSGETTVVLERRWPAARERIRFSIDAGPGDMGPPELDTLTIRSDALSLGLWVTEPTHRWMAEGGGPPDWEWWARSETEAWNATLDAAATDLIAEGVRDRMRLDRLQVIPEGSQIPMRDTDFGWVFWERNQDPRFMSSTHRSDWRDQTIVLHELLHQRGITDIYAYDVRHDDPGRRHVGILDPDGTPAVGTARMPLLRGGAVYEPDFDHVLMGDDYQRPTEVTSHTAYGLNLYAGRRTPYQIPDGLNVFVQEMNGYLHHIPDVIEIQLVDTAGAPLEAAAVDVFLDHGEGTYDKVYHPEPDFVLTADDGGVVVLPPEYGIGTPDVAVGEKSSVTILRARKDGQWGYAFLPVYYLNLAWIRGDRDLARIPVKFDMR